MEVPAVPYKELRGNSTAEPSSDIRARVERARAVQSARGYYNAQMPSRMIRKQCELDDAASARSKWRSAAWAFQRAPTTAF